VAGARGRSIEGSGIGLALVQELVTLHGGAITAESEVGRGTRFTIGIPFGTAHLPADQVCGEVGPATPGRIEGFVSEARRWLPDAEDAAADAVTEPPVGHGSGRVLLADDNADMRGYVERL